MPNNYDKLILSDQFNQKFTNSFILLDTSILINITLKKQSYLELFLLMDQQNCSYFTIDLCAYELYKGSETQEAFNQKKEIFEKLDISINPCNLYKTEFNDILAIYRKSGQDVSITDMFLAAALKKYVQNERVFLLTEDIGHFWGQFFTREVIVNIETNKHIKPLAFCRFNSTNFKKTKATF